jgi:Kef-type K+ transport system membrane component KefB
MHPYHQGAPYLAMGRFLKLIINWRKTHNILFWGVMILIASLIILVIINGIRHKAEIGDLVFAVVLVLDYFGFPLFVVLSLLSIIGLILRDANRKKYIIVLIISLAFVFLTVPYGEIILP